MDAFYDLVIDSYDYVGNYLILVFHDAYDVMTKTSDNNKLDESEEVYEYLLCAICPVNLTKPGLGYREDENRIGPRIRDWVVGARTPDLFSCFYRPEHGYPLCHVLHQRHQDTALRIYGIRSWLWL